MPRRSAARIRSVYGSLFGTLLGGFDSPLGVRLIRHYWTNSPLRHESAEFESPKFDHIRVTECF